VSLLLHEGPAIGHGQRGAVGDCDCSMSLSVVAHAAKVHRGGGEVEVGKVDLGVQRHPVLLWVSLVLHLKVLGRGKRQTNQGGKWFSWGFFLISVDFQRSAVVKR